jgi:transcriptional regulator with XRE-family HTH domain
MSNGEFLKLMGSKIKTQRELKKLSQKALATKCGLDPGSFWRIEVGQKILTYLL